MASETPSFSAARYVAHSSLHYWRTHAAVVLGVLVGTAVLTGALLVGDSVRNSLKLLTLEPSAASTASCSQTTSLKPRCCQPSQETAQPSQEVTQQPLATRAATPGSGGCRACRGSRKRRA